MKLEDRATLVAFLILGAPTIALTRLPRLLDGGVLLDGDEAIVALMAKHLLEGKDAALFFYGQSYGLSILESLSGAIGFATLGEFAVSLKLSTLALWSIGWIFLTLAIDRFVDRATAFGASFAVIFCAAWGDWSMMARGGYVTAFVLTSMALFLCSLTAMSTRRTPIACSLTGAVAALLFFAQPIFAVAFVPFVAFIHWARRQPVEIIATVLGGILTLVAVVVTTDGSWSDHWSPRIFGPKSFFDSIINLPERILIFFGGVYYYETGMPTGLMTRFGAVVWCVLLAFTLLAPALHFSRVRTSYLALSSLTSIVLVLALILCVSETSFGFRYLLPVATPLVLFLAALAHDSGPRSLAYRFAMPSVLSVLLVCGAIAHVDARQESRFGSHEDRQRAEGTQERLVEMLLEHGIRHAYCLDPMFQWNLMFVSGESVLARWRPHRDRYPEYPAAVDAALFASEPVALIGPKSDVDGFRGWLAQTGATREIHIVGTHYFWIENPDAAMLEQLGFELNRTSE